MEKLDTNEIVNMVNDQFMKSDRNLNRQMYNRQILDTLSKQEFFEKFVPAETAQDIYDVMTDTITDEPDWRFGQILTNRVYQSYRQRDIDSLNMVMDILFYGSSCSDPFYEESEETYKRLVRN